MPGFPSRTGRFACRKGTTQTALLKGPLMEDILILPGENLWMEEKGQFKNTVFPDQ